MVAWRVSHRSALLAARGAYMFVRAPQRWACHVAFVTRVGPPGSGRGESYWHSIPCSSPRTFAATWVGRGCLAPHACSRPDQSGVPARWPNALRMGSCCRSPLWWPTGGGFRIERIGQLVAFGRGRRSFLGVCRMALPCGVVAASLGQLGYPLAGRVRPRPRFRRTQVLPSR